jgi:hypothetical protein
MLDKKLLVGGMVLLVLGGVATLVALSWLRPLDRRDEGR